MRATAAAVAAVLLAASCGPVEDDESSPVIGLSVEDAPPALTVGGSDRLFALRYCPLRAPDGGPAQQDAPTYWASELHVEIVARHVQYASVWSLRYELVADLDHDRRFGPGDVLLVSERGRDVFAPTDTGTYQVRLFLGSRLLGAAEWMAR
ncbi:MAG TPA: hypothetical protein VGK67_11530 [Myxococcales bacterium]|jgi:hypothetical protein